MRKILKIISFHVIDTDTNKKYVGKGTIYFLGNFVIPERGTDFLFPFLSHMRYISHVDRYISIAGTWWKC